MSQIIIFWKSIKAGWPFAWLMAKNCPPLLTFWKMQWHTKVMYPKYSKHWPYTVAYTIDSVCNKMLNPGLNHRLFLSLFCLIIIIMIFPKLHIIIFWKSVKAGWPLAWFMAKNCPPILTFWKMQWHNAILCNHKTINRYWQT